MLAKGRADMVKYMTRFTLEGVKAPGLCVLNIFHKNDPEISVAVYEIFIASR